MTAFQRMLVLFLFILYGSCLFGQEDPELDKWMNMDLEELGKVRLLSISVGKKNLSVRESPGILSLITAAEIENSGARDLMDLLRMVPGFDFGIDVESAIGMGIRGNWAHEGKVMILLDGQEMNELLYATFPFGSHIPVEQIDRIEIIRGPGSSLYGGFAELAVINIVTKNNPGGDKLAISMGYGQMSRIYARRNINLMLDQSVGQIQFNLGVGVDQANRSQQDYTDIYGSTYDMKDNSGVNSLFLNLGMAYKKFSSRFVVDRYDYQQRDTFDAIYELPIKYCFYSYYLESKYELPVWKNLKLVPKINYSSQNPWNSTDENAVAQDNYYKVRVERLKFSVNLSGDISKSVFLNSSIIQYTDWGSVLGDTSEDLYFNGERKIQYSGLAFFMQSFIKTPWLIFSAGLRYDHHNLYGDSLVPWIGINKVYDKFYAKFLFGQTFRVPNIANINLGRDIKSEKSNEFDLELGYQIKPNMIISMNFFSTGIKNTIVYNVDPETDEEFYENFGQTGTWGFELEYLLKGGWGYFNTNYSFYRTKENKLDVFIVPTDLKVFLGFPAHKFTLNANILLTKDLSANPSLIYYSKRYGYDAVDEEENPILTEFEPVILANLFLNYKNIVKNLDAGLGVYDLFDKNFHFIQPYNGGHAPFPGTSREIVFRLRYRIE